LKTTIMDTSEGRLPVSLPPAGRLMALDVGDKRVGVAVCDEMQTLASPLAVLERRSRAEDLARLGRLATEQRVVGIVVGHPLNTDGSAPARRLLRGWPMPPVVVAGPRWTPKPPP
jgi:putative Holliday junction resolvase